MTMKPYRSASVRNSVPLKNAGPVPVQRGEREGLAEPEPVELERLGVAARIVELVRDDDDVAP